MGFPQMQVVADEGAQLMEHVLPHYYSHGEGGKIANFTLSNHIIMMFLAAFLVMVTFLYVGAKARKNVVPTGAHNFFEALLTFWRNAVIQPALGQNADRFAPYIWTVFFFILYCNLLG